MVDSKLKSAPFILICHFRISYYIIVLISFFIVSNRAKLLAIKKHWVLLDKLNSIMNICYLLGIKKRNACTLKQNFNRVSYNLTDDKTVFNMFESKKCIEYVENCQYKRCKNNIQTFNRVSYNLTKDITFFNMF